MTQRIKKYAVTGGIGSGKSLFLGILRGRGFPVFSCDEISDLLWKDTEYRRELARLFPACTKSGEIDRALLAACVFSDEASLRRLNGFSHPRILERLLAEMERCPVSFAEVPLLYEGGYAALFDGVIALRRSAERRVEDVMRRDGADAESVRLRMARQIDANSLDARGCIIVENDGTPDDLARRADEVLKRLHLA